jgi:hypothetical protein
MPDWWNRDCEKDTSLLPDLAIRIARLLETRVEAVEDQRMAELLALPSQ